MTLIPKRLVKDMFASMKRTAPWDIEAECLWSYYFTDRDRDQLTAVAEALVPHGYTFAGFLEPTPDDDDQETLSVQLDRVEAHTVKTLHKRNKELHELGERFPGVEYDGIELGPVDGPV